MTPDGSRRIAFGMALMWATLPCCNGSGAPDDSVCTTRLIVRLPDPDPLQTPAAADRAAVWLEREGVTVFDETVILYGPTRDGVAVDIRATDGAVPSIESSSKFRLGLTAFASTPFSGEILAVGRTPLFGCVDEPPVSVPLYIGPANRLATAAGQPADVRIGATVSLIDDHRVLIAGGQDATGAPATPTAILYDHSTGRFCGVDDGCLANDLPARIDHTATTLDDGSVLIFGGRTPGTTTALGDLLLFEPATSTFVPIEIDGVTPEGRAQHAAVFLGGSYLPAALRGKLLIIGGCGDDCAVGTTPGSALLIDPRQATATALDMPEPRYDTTATLMDSGRVLIAGGRAPGGQLLGTVLLFDTVDRSFVTPILSCVAEIAGQLCARRAGHTATLLDDDNVLLWGGDVEPYNAGESPPQAEVFLLQDEVAIPAVKGASAMAARAGHTASRIDCRHPPCPILILGGGTPAALLYSPATAQPSPLASYYDGTHLPLSGAALGADRAYHVAAALPDGTVLIAYGETTGQVSAAVVFSHCEPTTGLSCPAQ